MKGLRAFLSLGLGFVLCIIMGGCAAKAPPNPPGALHLAQFTLSDGVINISYRQLLVATGGQQPYTWTMTAGQLPPGLTMTTDGVISGTPTTTGRSSFTIKVTDSQTPTAAYTTLSTSITINPPLSLVTAQLPSGVVGQGYTATITATEGLSPYTYAVASGALPDGLTLDPAMGTISGTPTSAGVFDFTIQATDADSEVATATFTITVVGRLQGPYAITFNGFDSSQPAGSQAFYMVAGITAGPTDDQGNGTITGVIDQNGPGGTISAALPLLAGSAYSLPVATNFGTVTLVTSLGTYVYDIVVSSQADSRLMLSDANHPTVYGSGLVKKQLVTVLPNTGGSFSFGYFGNDNAGNRSVGAGMFVLGSTTTDTLPVTAGEEDLNDNGTVASQVFITGGGLTQVDPATGRGTLAITTGSGTVNYVSYLVSGKELVAMQEDAGGPMTLMSIVQQQLPGASGSFSNASLTMQGILQLDGVAMSGGNVVPAAAVGVAAFDGMGNIVGPMGSNGALPGYYTDESDGGTVTQVQYATGTYNVDPMCGTITTACGRVTVNLSGAPAQPVWYLSSTNQGFAISTDAQVMQGTLQQQSTTNAGFNISALLGSYLGSTMTPTLASITNELDVAGTPPPGGIWNLTYKSNGPDGPGQSPPDMPVMEDYDCGPMPPACSDLGKYYGRFELTNQMDHQPLSIIFVIGTGSSGITGGKGGLVGVNVGDIAPVGGLTTPDANPRLSTYGH